MTVRETILRLGEMSEKYKQKKIIHETMQKVFGEILSDSVFDELNYQTREEFYYVLQQNKQKYGENC